MAQVPRSRGRAQPWVGGGCKLTGGTQMGTHIIMGTWDSEELGGQPSDVEEVNAIGTPGDEEEGCSGPSPRLSLKQSAPLPRPLKGRPPLPPPPPPRPAPLPRRALGGTGAAERDDEAGHEDEDEDEDEEEEAS